MRLHGRTLALDDPPIPALYAALPTHTPGARLDLAQAAPCYPPAPPVRHHVARVARDSHGGDYTDVPGLPRLRDAVAADITASYRGAVSPENVVITAGCNQAFCLVIKALAAPGDQVVLPLPYYFNHDMWLRMNDVSPIYANTDDNLVPAVADMRSLITERTRAIVLVTPGNPTGVAITSAEIAQFAALAREFGIALILDETYRSFRDTDAPAHTVFDSPDWDETVVSLHSFSKDFAIPGYRVGAVVASPRLNREIVKLLDCLAVCAPRIGQEAAWAGLTYGQEWRADKVRHIASLRSCFADVMADRPGGFELVSCGGFFGWIRHPLVHRRSDDVARLLAERYGAIVMPGTAFSPDDRAMLRVSVSNGDPSAFTRLAEYFADLARTDTAPLGSTREEAVTNGAMGSPL